MVSSGSTFGCTLGAAPAQGSVILISTMFVGLTLNGVSDGTHAFTLPATHCSTTNNGTAGTSCVAYLICPAGGCGTVITATASGTCTSGCNEFVDPFTVTLGTLAIDGNGVAGGGAACGATAGCINTPTVTLSGTGELIYTGSTHQHAITAVCGSWTAITAGITNGNWAEYQLAAASSQATCFNVNTVGTWDSMGMAFTFTTSATANPAQLMLTGTGI